MRVLRALLGALLWILAAVVGLLGIVLSVTVILLPLGIPLLMLARRMFTRSVALVLPRPVAHPVDETRRKARKKGRDAVTDLDVKKLGKRARKKMSATENAVRTASRRRRRQLSKAVS